MNAGSPNYPNEPLLVYERWVENGVLILGHFPTERDVSLRIGDQPYLAPINTVPPKHEALSAIRSSPVIAPPLKEARNRLVAKFS